MRVGKHIPGVRLHTFYLCAAGTTPATIPKKGHFYPKNRTLVDFYTRKPATLPHNNTFAGTAFKSHLPQNRRAIPAHGQWCHFFTVS
jgi:hypothetical protein